MNGVQGTGLVGNIAYIPYRGSVNDNIFIKTDPMGYDTYGKEEKKSGHPFLKLAAIVAAVVFRKQIGAFALKHFPGISAKIVSVATKVANKVKGTFVEKAAKGVWNKYLAVEKYVGNKISTLCAKENLTKCKDVAKDVGKYVLDKATAAKNWVCTKLFSKAATVAAK